METSHISDNYSKDELDKICFNYEKSKMRMNKYLKDRYANDEVFREQAKARSRENYQKNKEKIKMNYLKKKTMLYPAKFDDDEELTSK
jgi:hypothetical protein